MKNWLFRPPCDPQCQSAARRLHSPPLARRLRFELLEDRWMLAADMWTASGSGFWDVAGNWSAGVPTSSSAVTISTAGAAIITIRTAASAQSVMIAGSTDTLSIASGSLTTSANLSNSGTLTVPPHITVKAGSFTQTSTGTLDIQLGGAPSSGDFGLVNVTGAATLAGTLKSELVYGLFARDDRQLHSHRVRQQVGHLFDLFASEQFDLSVRRRRHVYQRRGQCRPRDDRDFHDQRQREPRHHRDQFSGHQPGLLGRSSTDHPDPADDHGGRAQMYRFPGGSDSDNYHFNVSANFDYSAAITIPQFAQFISAVGGTGLVTLDYGSGSPQEAAAELAYLQGSTTDTTAIGTGMEWNGSTNVSGRASIGARSAIGPACGPHRRWPPTTA